MKLVFTRKEYDTRKVEDHDKPNKFNKETTIEWFCLNEIDMNNQYVRTKRVLDYVDVDITWQIGINYQVYRNIGANGETYIKIDGLGFEDLEKLYNQYKREKKLIKITKI